MYFAGTVFLNEDDDDDDYQPVLDFESFYIP